MYINASQILCISSFTMRILALLPVLLVRPQVASALSIHGIQHYAGSLFSSISSVDEGTINTGPETEWACDIRAWTRAPDLFPGAIVPAEARLAANGSACVDIVGWEAGLRYKERAIVKMKWV